MTVAKPTSISTPNDQRLQPPLHGLRHSHPAQWGHHRQRPISQSHLWQSTNRAFGPATLERLELDIPQAAALRRHRHRRRRGVADAPGIFEVWVRDAAGVDLIAGQVVLDGSAPRAASA